MYRIRNLSNKLRSGLLGWLVLVVVFSCNENVADYRTKSDGTNVIDACGNVLGETTRNDEGKKVFKANESSKDEINLRKECDSADSQRNVMTRNAVDGADVPEELGIDGQVSSLALQIDSNELIISRRESFKVMAILNDGTEQDVTPLATVTSAAPEILSVRVSDQSGFVEGLQAGSARVIANIGAKSATANFTVLGTSLLRVFATPPFFKIVVGEKIPLALSGAYSDGVIRYIDTLTSWTSATPTIARINEEEYGSVLEAMRPGSVNIQTTMSGLTAAAPVTVVSALFTSIEIVSDVVAFYQDTAVNPPTLNVDLPKNESVKFAIKGTTTDGLKVNPVPGVTWTINDPTAATIADDGTVTCTAMGIATVTVTIGTQTLQFIVHCYDAALTEIAITPSQSTIPVGFGEALTAKGKYSTADAQRTFYMDVTNKAVWTSANTAVVQIRQVYGQTVAHALSANTAAIDVTAKIGSITGTSAITAKTDTLTEIEIEATKNILKIGDYVDAKATAAFASGASLDVTRHVNWSTSDASAVLPENDGKNKGRIYGVAVGGAKVSAKIGTVEGILDFGVMGDASTFSLAPMNATIPFNRDVAFHLAYKPNPTVNIPVTGCVWETSNPAIVSINQQGVAHGAAEGAARVSCLVYGIRTQTDVMVSAPTVTAVRILTPSTTNLNVGETLQLSAQALREDGTTSTAITWSSSDTTKATVSDTGLVTGIAAGAVSIRATASGTSTQISLTVNVIGTVANVTFNPIAGVLDNPAMVALSTATAGASIWYTTNGSPATTQSTPYTGEISVPQNMTINAIASKNGYNNSQNVSAVYSVRVAAPSPNLPAGSFSSAQSVTLASGTNGAQIFFTTDGTDPVTSSTATQYQNPIPINSTTTIKAVAKKTGMDNSTTVSLLYQINGTVSMVTFSPAGGALSATTNVTLQTSTPNAEIRYTLDGSTPTASSTIYTSPIQVTGTTTIKAIAIKTSFTSSAVASAAYTFTASAPVFSPAPGGFPTETIVTVSSSTTGADIFYTLDGSDPSQPNNSSRRASNGMVTISATSTLKAVAVKTGFTNSSVTSGLYSINGSVADVTFSPSGGQKTGSINVTLTTATQGATIRYTLDGSSATANSPTYNGMFPVASNTTVRAIATKDGFANSTERSVTYSFKLPNPQISVATGSYATAQAVTLSVTGAADASIYFTTNGSNPADSTNTQRFLWVGLPINITQSATLKAVTTKVGMDPSDVVSATYTINGSASPVSFSVPGGLQNGTNPISVTLTSATAGATIRYTEDGSDPFTSSTVQTYANALNIASNKTIRAFARANGFADSGENSVSYSFKVATPSFTPSGGTFSSAQNVVISSATSGSSIFYTLDNSDPANSGTRISLANGGSVNISSTKTLRAIAAKPNLYGSSERSEQFTITGAVANVSFSIPGGQQTGDGPISVELSTSTAGATIYYRTDGTHPVENAAGTYAYGGAISVGSLTTIKAKAVKSGWTSSAITSATYSFKAATPTANVDSGTYSSAQSVTFSTTTPNADIYYTTNGTDPRVSTNQRTKYAGAISVSASTSFIVAAIRVGFTDSDTLTRSYNVTGGVANVTFTPAAGQLSGNGPTNITLATSTANATIRFTTDGSDPTAQSPAYTNPVSISEGKTIKAMAMLTGWNNSSITSAQYTYKVATPTFGVSGGTYSTPQNVVISTTTPSTTIYYTTDGSQPTVNSTPYTGGTNGLLVDRSMTLKAIAARSGFSASDVASIDYTITGSVAAVQFAPAAGAQSNNSTINVVLTTSTPGATIKYSTNASVAPAQGTIYTAGTSGLPFSTNTTIKAIATLPGWTDSAISTATYTWTAATPVANVASGTYSTAQTVALTTSTIGGDILYTLDGSDPATSSTAASYNALMSSTVPAPAGIAIASTKTLRAVAKKTGYNNSAEFSAMYTINGTVANVVISVPTNTTTPANAPLSVTLSTSTAGATIYYTTNGTAPAQNNGTVYTGAITVDQPLTLKAIAVLNGWTSSAIASATYAFQAGAPTLTPANAEVNDQNITVFLTTTTPSAVIYYTTNGTTPTTASLAYNGNPFVLSSSATVRAMAVRTGWQNSAVSMGDFKINHAPTSIALSGTVVHEGLPAGTMVGTLSAVDVDAGSTFTFALDSTATYPHNSMFAISGTSLSVATPLTLTSYTIRIKVTDNTGLTKAQDFVITVPRLTPTNLAASVISNNQINLTWTDVSTAESGYFVFRSDNGGAFTQIANFGANTNGFSNTGLMANTTYQYKVAAAVGGVLGAMSNAVSATTSGTVSAVTFSMAASTIPFSTPFYLMLSSGTASAAIYYTTDGTTPTTASTRYLGQFMVDKSQTVQAVAYLNGAASAVTSANYLFKAATPNLIPSGTGADTQTVTFSSSSPGTTVYYTTNGTTPTTASIIATGPITFYNTTTVKAIAVRTGWDVSNVASQTFIVNHTPTLVGLNPMTLYEGLAPGAFVGTLTAADADVGDTHTFVLDNSTGSYPDNARFSISGSGLSTAETLVASTASKVIRVKATDSGGLSRVTDFAMPVQRLTPSGLTATALSASEIRLNWADNSTVESGFQVSRSTDGVNFSPIATLAANTTTYTATLLAANTGYYFKIAAYVGEYVGTSTAAAFARTNSIFAISTFYATYVDQQPSQSNYLHFTLNQPGNCQISVGHSYTNVTSVTNISIAPTQTTTYSLACSGVAGGNASAQVTVTVSTPSPVINSFVSTPSSVELGKSASISWSSSNTSTCSMTKTTNGGVTTNMTFAGSLSFPTGGSITVLFDTVYTLTLRCTGNSGAIVTANLQPPIYAASATSTTSTTSALPAVPSLSVSAGYTNATVTINNFVSSGVTYALFMGTAPGAVTTQIATTFGSSPSFDKTGLVSGTAYYFKVRATNSAGSTNSPEVMGTPPAVPLISALAGSATSATITISNYLGSAVGYQLYTGTSFSNVNTLVTASMGASYTATGLPSGVINYFVVEATNTAGISASVVATASTKVPTMCSVPAWNSPATSCSGTILAQGSMLDSDSPADAAQKCLAANKVGATCCMYHLYGAGIWYVTNGQPQQTSRLCETAAGGTQNYCLAGGACQ